MNSSKIKVAMCANSLGINGISTVIMNYCTHLDRDKFENHNIRRTPHSRCSCRELC